jgi:hypothetical protein
MRSKGRRSETPAKQRKSFGQCKTLRLTQVRRIS